MARALKGFLAGLCLLSVPFEAGAEVAVTGDAFMGLEENFRRFPGDANNIELTNRTRVRFNMSGETDMGLSFGATIRLDEFAFASPTPDRGWTTGVVYVASSLGKLSMGDVDSAAEAAVGHVAGVGMTGLGDNNETTYAQTGFGASMGPTLLYEYYGTGWAVFASMTKQADYFTVPSLAQNISVGGRMTFGDLVLSAGFEKFMTEFNPAVENWNVGAAYKIGDFNLKGIYGKFETYYNGYESEQYSMSVDWTQGPFTATAFVARQPDAGEFDLNATYLGIGGLYDLGGGAALSGGWVRRDGPSDSFFLFPDTAFDFGMTLTF